MPTLVTLGSNHVLVRPLYQADGSTLAAASLVGARVALSQRGVAVKTFVLGTDPELRAHPTNPAAIELELTAAFTATLKAGQLTERWSLTVPNTAIVVEGGQQHDTITLNDVVLG